MKSVVRISALLMLLLPAALVTAQEPQAHPMAGGWSGPMVPGGDVSTEVSLDLRIQGDVVTGPIVTTKAGDLYIRNGSVTGNTIQFTSPNVDPEQQVALVWTGQLTGAGEIAFSVVPETGDAPAREFVLAKQTLPGGGR